MSKDSQKKTETNSVCIQAAILRAISFQSNYRVLTKAILSMKPIAEDTIPVAAVDEWWRLYWNPEVFKGLNINAAVAVLVHEVWHLLRFHTIRSRILRVKPEEHFLWNVACDLEIHADHTTLINDLNKNMPEDLKPLTLQKFPKLSTPGTAEIWFKELKKDSKPVNVPDKYKPLLNSETVLVPGSLVGDGTGKVPWHVANGSGVGGDKRDHEKDSPLTGGPSGVSTEKADIIQRAVAHDISQSSTTMGSSNGGMVRWAEKIITPKVDWRTHLNVSFQGFVSNKLGSLYATWRKVSRRQSHDKRILKPGRQGLSPRVAVIIDTSGSMSDDMISSCTSELSSLLAVLGKSAYVHVYSCDARAHDAQITYNTAEVKLYGGGGTDMRKAFELIEKDRTQKHYEFDLVILMTDGYTEWPKESEMLTPTLLLLVKQERNHKFPAVPAYFSQQPHDVVYVDVE